MGGNLVQICMRNTRRTGTTIATCLFTRASQLKIQLRRPPLPPLSTGNYLTPRRLRSLVQVEGTDPTRYTMSVC